MAKLPDPRIPGPIEQEAIDRGEAPMWIAVARRMDELEARLAATAAATGDAQRLLGETSGLLGEIRADVRRNVGEQTSHREGKIVGEGEGR